MWQPLYSGHFEKHYKFTPPPTPRVECVHCRVVASFQRTCTFWGTLKVATLGIINTLSVHSMACCRRVALIANCGYARVSIYENSHPGRTGQHARKTIDVPRRMRKFSEQFSTHPGYGIPSGYFEGSGKDNCSQFDQKILDGFGSKFRSDIGLCRDSYVSIFSSQKWFELPNAEKNKHTLGNCNRCFELYEKQQRSFPLKPVYQPQPPIITVDPDALQKQGLQKFTSNVLSELNSVYNSVASTSFTDALLNTRSIGLEKKKTKMEKKKEKREIEKELTRKVNKQFAEKAAITLLVEGESKRNTTGSAWLNHSSLLENNLHKKKRKPTLLNLKMLLGTLQG